MTNDHRNEAAPQAGAEDGERIAKVLARAGLCSRREAEEWVLAGRVAVDGKVLATPAVVVGPKNRITVDGTPLPQKERTRLWLFHKPRGLVTTTHDPEGRPTVFSVLPEDMPRVVTVGRLDINTEGLLLLTNDGGVARVLELPATGWLRRYRVRAFGEVDQAALKELSHGVSLDGVDYGPIEAEIERVQGHNSWLVLGLREGKNREVKRVLASLGLTVNRLIRVSFGPFQLADLEEGEIREIRGRVLKDQLGKRLVAESGADFDAPIVNHIHGAEDEEAPKRRIRDFTPAEERSERKGRPERTKMDFIGTGERRRNDDGPRRGRDDGGERPRFRSEGFRDRGGPQGKPRSEGFRDRGPGGGKPGGFRDRPEGGGKPGGFRDRPEGGRPRSEGFRDRDAGRAEGFRDRPSDGEGFRGRSEGPRGNRGDWDFKGRPKGPMRPDGDAPRGRNERFGDGEGRGRPRSEGFRGAPAGDGERNRRSEGFKGRPDGGFGSRGGAPRGDAAGERPRASGFKPKPDATGFGPKGPRGMSTGDRRPDRGGADADGGDRAGKFGGRPGGRSFSDRGGSDRGGFERGGSDRGGSERGGFEKGRGGSKGPGGKSFGPKGDGPRGFGPKGSGPKGSGPRGFSPRGGGPGGGGPKGRGPRSGGPKGGRS